MTVAEFEAYLQKGLGRAILLLREEPDKRPFLEVVLAHLIGGRNLYYYSEKTLAYVLDLLDCFDERDALLQEVVGGICRKIAEGDFFGNNELLLAFGMEQAYKESFHKRYRIFREKTISHIRERNTSVEAINDRQRFLNAHIPLIRDADREEIRAILTDLIDLYALTEETEYPYRFPEAIQIRMRLEKRFGKEEATDIIQEVAEAHPSGALLLQNVHYRRAEPLPPDPAVTAKEILDTLSLNAEDLFIRESYYQRAISFTVASPEVVRQVAEALLAESDLARRTTLLKLFHPYAYLYQNTLHSEPRFPLGEEALLPLLDDVDWQSQISENGFVTEYIDALLTVISPFRHPKLKSLSEALRKEGYPLARYGIDLLISQYTAADRETLISCLREAPISESGFDELSRILHYLLHAAQNGTSDLPLDVIPSLWERIPTDNLRKDAVEVLLQYEILPDDLREECRYDRNLGIRELIKEL